jgi:hypothetical protein
MTIWLIMYHDEYVGSFFQNAYSTEELAKKALENMIAKQPTDADHLSIEEYQLDSESL